MGIEAQNALKALKFEKKAQLNKQLQEMNQQLNEVNKQLGGIGPDLITRKIKKKKKLVKNRDKIDIEKESKSDKPSLKKLLSLSNLQVSR